MTMPSPWDQLVAVAADFDRPRLAKLRAGAAIVTWIKSLPRLDAHAPRSAMLGVPVHPDRSLDDGQWQALDQYGGVITEGRIGEPGEHLIYSAGKFYALNRDVLS